MAGHQRNISLCLCHFGCLQGGSADVLELKAGDEIIAIDGADVANHYLESVQSVISQAVGVGQLELRIRRVLSHS